MSLNGEEEELPQERQVGEVGVRLRSPREERYPFIMIYPFVSSMYCNPKIRHAQHTQERVDDQDEETLHSIDSLKLLEQAKIENRVYLAV